MKYNYKIGQVDCNEPQIYTTDNKPIRIDSKADMEITIPKLPNDISKVSAFISDNLTYNYIFSIYFLESQGVILNFRKKLITISNGDVEMVLESENGPLTQKFHKKLQTSLCATPYKACTIVHSFRKDDLHMIHTYPDVDIRKKEHPVPLKLVDNVRNELLCLQKEGIIRKSVNGWALPAFSTANKNGKVRLIVRYR